MEVPTSMSKVNNLEESSYLPHINQEVEEEIHNHHTLKNVPHNLVPPNNNSMELIPHNSELKNSKLHSLTFV